MIDSNSLSETKEWVIKHLNSVPLLEVEYFEIVDEEFNMMEDWDHNKSMVGCLAVQAGNIRLIDNVEF